MFEIKPRMLPDDTASVTYEGTVIKLRTCWNSREEAWYLSIYRADDTPLVCGHKILQTQNITARNTLDDFALFDVYSINKNKNQSRPAYSDIGNTLTLAFVTKEETAEVIANFSKSVIYV